MRKRPKKGASIDPVGYDAGKKTKGIKRNAIVDTEGHLLSDRGDPGQHAGSRLRRRLDPQGVADFPAPAQDLRRWRLCRAEAGKLRSLGSLSSIEIVKRTDKDGGFKVIRRRWVIERTFSWLRRNRRLMAHYEAIAMIAVHFAKLAMISVMLKRLTEPKPPTAT